MISYTYYESKNVDIKAEMHIKTKATMTQTYLRRDFETYAYG